MLAKAPRCRRIRPSVQLESPRRHVEYDSAKHVSAFDVLVRPRDLGERIDGGDGHLEASLGNRCVELLELTHARLRVVALDAEPAALARFGLDPVGIGEASPFLHGVESGRELRAAGKREHRVDAIGGEVIERGFEIVCPAVDHFVRS